MTWTTYGTWLPGDPKKPGHWSPLFDVYGRIAGARHQLNPPDDASYQQAQQRMKEPEMVLSDNAQSMIAQVIAEHLKPGMPGEHWNIFAAAIESTHVHLLFGPVDSDIAKVIGRLKSRSSSELLRLPDNAGRSRIWTRGYWKAFLFDHEGVCIVAQYIMAHNERRGLSARRFDWTTDIPI